VSCDRTNAKGVSKDVLSLPASLPSDWAIAAFSPKPLPDVLLEKVNGKTQTAERPPSARRIIAFVAVVFVAVFFVAVVFAAVAGLSIGFLSGFLSTC
jgi:hypothetical protein